MMKVQYVPATGRVDTFEVWLVQPSPILVGFVHRSEDATWAARLRGHTFAQLAHFESRSAAAIFLLTFGEFAKAPQQREAA